MLWLIYFLELFALTRAPFRGSFKSFIFSEVFNSNKFSMSTFYVCHSSRAHKTYPYLGHVILAHSTILGGGPTPVVGLKNK